MTSSNAETGFYTNTFAVSSSWASKKIFLVFEGVMTDTSVSINAQPVGPTHQGGYYEFRYDVTPYVVVGASTNILTVTVRKFSANPYVEGAEEGNVDYWIFAGIFRPVYLEAKPSTYIDYVAANPLSNGNITVSAYLGGINTNYTVQACDRYEQRHVGQSVFQFRFGGGDERGVVRLVADTQCVVFRNADTLHFERATGGHQRCRGA